MTSKFPEFAYEPSESIYQHYAWANNGKVSLCNDADGEYEQVFGSPEELQRFIDHLMVIANEAWPSVDEYEYTSYESIEELFEDLHADEKIWLKKKLDAEDAPWLDCVDVFKDLPDEDADLIDSGSRVG